MTPLQKIKAALMKLPEWVPVEKTPEYRAQVNSIIKLVKELEQDNKITMSKLPPTTYVLVPEEWLKELQVLTDKSMNELNVKVNERPPLSHVIALIGFIESAETILKYNERVKK